MSLAVRPVVDADHAGRWFRRELVGTNPAQHGLAAARQTLAGELAGACCATQCQASVTLGLAHPGGGVGIRTGHRRHPLGAGPPATGGGSTQKAPDVEVEAHRDGGPGESGQGPTRAAMAAGRRLRTGGTGGGWGGDLPIQGQALSLEGEGLDLARRGEETSTEVMQQQHRLLLSWAVCWTHFFI
jgi:hypothetical protein